MPRTLDVALAEDALVPEGGLRLAPRCRQRLLELAWLAHDAHATAAATRSRLDHQREADLVRLALGHDRHAGLPGDPLRLELVTAGPQRRRRRPDPDEPRRFDGLREVWVLRQEPVPRVNRVGAASPAPPRMCSSGSR